MRTIMIPTLLVMSALFSCTKTTPSSPEKPPAIPREAAQKAGFQTPSSPLIAEDFALPGLDGADVSLKSLRGNVVLVNFWATWCPPCRDEIPSLESLHAKYKAKGLRVLSIDVAEDKAVVQKYVMDNKMETTVLFDADAKVGAAYGAQSIPLTYVVSKDGSVVGRTLGSRDWGSPEVASLIETLLAAK